MGLDCGHLKVDWERRATDTLYDFWKYLTEEFNGSYVEGYGGMQTYDEEELQGYAQEFEKSTDIDDWIAGLFAGSDEYVTLVWNW